MKKGRIPLQTIQRKTPAAPPAYRPMPVPKVLQRKTAVAGPNVNKPLPIPHVLQRKAITHPQPPRVPVKPNPLVQRMQPARPGILRPAIVQTKVVQRAAAPKWSFGQSDEDMNDKQWFKSGMATFVSIMIDAGGDELKELGIAKSLKTKTFGPEHAEDVAMRALLAEYGAGGLKGLHIILNLSKSPCSSTYKTTDKKPGCAENLVKFAKTYKVRITLICRGLYKGLEGSMLAVQALRDEGIAVSIDERLGAQKRYGEHKDAMEDDEED